VRQFRYAINSDLLEIPAGTLEPDEQPESCAVRELEEETGYSAGEISKILECYVAPGYSTEKIHFFLARKLTQTRMHTEEDEVIKLEIMPLQEAFQRLRDGKIRDAKTACGLYRLRELL
jgi:ADP-ribose pyrophosphatase